MNWKACILVLSYACACYGAGYVHANDQDQEILARSRSLTQAYAQQLQAALQSALADSGPVGAIHVCKRTAVQIAAELARQSGAKIGRTSLRVRNPVNMPEPWQAQVLRTFESRQQGGAVGSFEHLQSLSDGSVRYMKAIPIKPLCLTCHGASLTPDVENALTAAYPHDQARGYSLGEIRGAFTVTWGNASR